MALKLTVMPLDIDPDSKPVIQVFDKEELTIGRLPSNDIVLNRPEVSGIHARVRIEPSFNGDASKIFITDLGSSNGTMVEKNPLRARVEVAMMPNERIFIGNFVIKPAFQVNEETESVSLDGNNSTAEMRRAYLSDALKEYEEGKKKQDETQDLESSIDRFTEQRAVGNGTATNSFLSALMDSDGSSTPVKESSSLGIKAMYGNEKKEEEPLSPYVKGYFKQVQEHSSENFAAVATTNEDEVAPIPSRSAPTLTTTRDALLNGRHHEETNMPLNFASKGEPKSGGNDVLSVKVKVDGSDINSFNFSASAYSDVTGSVIYKGQPLSGVTVKAGSLGKVVTSSDGSFTFSKILEGTNYSIELEKDKFIFEPKTFSGTVSLDAPTHKVNAIQVFTISGVITHQGKPLAGVEVDGGDLGKVTTDSNGLYKFENVPEGKEYDLKLSKPGYAFAK